jgi:hypothetical protein
MPFELTAAQVLALAPDAVAVSSAKKLAKPGPWKNTGQSAAALWGECRGATLYQTQVALVDLASKCSCPSRKFPCKHALGLLLFALDAPQSFPEAGEPEWVQSWLKLRGAAQKRKAARAEKPVDAEAASKRAEKRHDKILAGLDQLDMWMNDLVRQGLARVQNESFGFWDAQARRLVDAQAGGLASRVRGMGGRVGRGDDWAARLLDDLGQLALLSHAYRRIDQLAAPLAADLRRSVGITLDQSEVIAHGDVVEDEWQVLSAVIEEDERMRTQRAWLWGASSQRVALVLQFAAGSVQFEQHLLAGTKLRARLAFWPSAAPQRALVLERLSLPEDASAAPAGASVERALERFSELLAGCPWFDVTFLVLAEVVPLAAAVADGTGASLPLTATDHAVLFALSGGHPVTLAGEWDGYAFAPRTAWAEGRMIALGKGA